MTAILSLLSDDALYQQNALRQDLWRAGHAHAGVLPENPATDYRSGDQFHIGGTLAQHIPLGGGLAGIGVTG